MALLLSGCCHAYRAPTRRTLSTTLQTEDNITLGPKLKRLKNRKNLRTTGFNL